MKTLNSNNFLYIRYFINDDRSHQPVTLNNGFDLPSAFKQQYPRPITRWRPDTNFSSSWVNELRMQYGPRTFDFPSSLRSLNLEVANTFAVGVNARATLTSTARAALNSWTTSPHRLQPFPQLRRKLRLGSHLRILPVVLSLRSRLRQPAGISWHRWRRALLLHRHAVPRSIRALLRTLRQGQRLHRTNLTGGTHYQGGLFRRRTAGSFRQPRPHLSTVFLHPG